MDHMFLKKEKTNGSQNFENSSCHLKKIHDKCDT